MWDGVFSSEAKIGLIALQLSVFLVLAHRKLALMRRPRFPGAIVAFLILIAVAAPIPAYLVGGVGFWAVALVGGALGFPPNVGLAGFIVAPPLFCLALLSLLSPIFSKGSKT